MEVSYHIYLKGKWKGRCMDIGEAKRQAKVIADRYVKPTDIYQRKGYEESSDVFIETVNPLFFTRH